MRLPLNPESAITSRSAEPERVAIGVLPERFVCPACQYDLAASEIARCSECGRWVTVDDLGTHHLWLKTQSNLRRRVLTQLAAYVVIALVLAAGVAVLSRSVVSAVAGAGVTGAALTMSMAGGWTISRLSGPRIRDLRFAAWLKLHGWLHGPWLCIPVCSVLATVARVFGTRQLEAVAGAGLVLWLASPLACLIIWAMVYGLATKAYRLQGNRHDIAAVLLALCVLACAAVLGLVGGSATVEWLSAW